MPFLINLLVRATFEVYKRPQRLPFTSPSSFILPLLLCHPFHIILGHPVYQVIVRINACLKRFFFDTEFKGVFRLADFDPLIYQRPAKDFFGISLGKYSNINVVYQRYLSLFA